MRRMNSPIGASFSLRRRLLAMLLGVIVAMWTTIAALSYVDANQEIDELFDAQLAQSARILLAQVAHELTEGSIDIEHGHDSGHPYEIRMAFQVWEAGEKLVLHSANAPLRHMTSRTEGYTESTVGEHVWRVFTRWDENKRYLIQIGERVDFRHDLARQIIWRMMYPLLVALPLMAWLIWGAVGRGLLPLKRVATEVEQRDPQNIAPLQTASVPQEVAPLVHSLNNLFGRLQEAFDKERRFTADAAHELRSPLAALKTHAQVALAATADHERRRALQQVIQGVDRATHLVQQLLTLARLDPQAALNVRDRTDLRAVAANCVAELAPVAIAKKISLGLTECPPVWIMGDATMLGVLVRNLVDNAIRYTPPGGNIEVSVIDQGGRASLQVNDDGPGISPDERGKVFDRFYRVLGTNETGSGLGLSIVGSVAQSHGAVIRLEDGKNGRGLCVSVDFPVTHGPL